MYRYSYIYNYIIYTLEVQCWCLPTSTYAFHSCRSLPTHLYNVDVYPWDMWCSLATGCKQPYVPVSRQQQWSIGTSWYVMRPHAEAINGTAFPTCFNPTRVAMSGKKRRKRALGSTLAQACGSRIHMAHESPGISKFQRNWRVHPYYGNIWQLWQCQALLPKWWVALAVKWNASIASPTKCYRSRNMMGASRSSA